MPMTVDPTPAEITAMCAVIRQDWSEYEHRIRAGCCELHTIRRGIKRGITRVIPGWQVPVARVRRETGVREPPGPASD